MGRIMFFPFPCCGLIRGPLNSQCSSFFGFWRWRYFCWRMFVAAVRVLNCWPNLLNICQFTNFIIILVILLLNLLIILHLI